MHLTPEQIERQPFRMQKRGYDIADVRDFLREISGEMRERRGARQETGELPASHPDHAADVLADAARIRTAAESDAEATKDEARVAAANIVAEAEAHANALITNASAKAESDARERSDVVLTASQSRLDQLLEKERQVAQRIDRLDPVSVDTAVAQPAISEINVTDLSLAEFMKATLRNEVA